MEDFFLWHNRLLLPLFLIGILGNCIIIIYFIRINKNKLRQMSVYHFLVISLAIVDLLICLTTPVMRYYDTQPQWHLDEFACKFIRPLSYYVLPYISCWIIVVLSYERYQTIVNPFGKRTSKRACLLTMCFLSIVFLGMFTDFFVGNKLENRKCYAVPDSYGRTGNVVFTILERLFDCFLPTCIMTVCYQRIMCSFKRQDRRASCKTSLKRKQTALRTLKYLIIVYVVFVFPGRIFGTVVYLFSLYNEAWFQEYLGTLTPIYFTLLFMCSFNNMVNVFVFIWLVPEFRKFVKNPCGDYTRKAGKHDTTWTPRMTMRRKPDSPHCKKLLMTQTSISNEYVDNL
ncbi:melatonin receptor type 1B-B-like [Clytia hemisphaerica]|uniref:melatonin receptor type 1B-B-like n=1 Tax=Clytia hemisphaerica TaxID=252671 RepID=UPI0034D46158